MSALRIGFGAFLGALCGLSGCGGTTSDGTVTASSVRESAPERCRAACENIVPCPQSCDCGCACAAGDPNCTCDTTCTCQPQTVDACTSECVKQVDEELTQFPECADEMSAMLTCVATTACPADGTRACVPEVGAVKACTSSPKTTPGTVTCSAANGGSAGSAADGGVGSCSIGWSGCSDGNRYEIRCMSGTCECVVNDQVQSTFPGTICPDMNMTAANQSCGWALF